MRTLSIALFILSLGCVSQRAAAHPLVWPVGEGGNGHAYDAIWVADGVTWEEARVMAEQLTHEGAPGHLATLTSQAEYDFVWNSLGDVMLYWIGGHRVDRDGAPDEGWAWVTGEPWSYTNWCPGEPNNSSANPDGYEDCLQIGRSDDPVGWNDLWPSARVPGFVVEFDLEQVPVPAASVGAMKSRY